MRDAAHRGAAENVVPARDPDADPLADAEEAAEEIVERNPDPETAREAFEREIAERGESEEGAEIGTLTHTDDRRAIEEPPPDQR
jgi:hypothetical protein